MLRLHLMQNGYCLSDEAMEDALIQVESIRRFARLDLAKGLIPDAGTILAFRHFLENTTWGEDLREDRGVLERTRSAAEGGHRCGCHHRSWAHLHQEREGAERPRDASNPQGEPLVVWHEGSRWGGQGFRADPSRASNSSDVVVASEPLHGEERKGKEVECDIALRPVNRRRLPATAEGQLLQWVERAKAHIRAKVEHPFRVIKQQFGLGLTYNSANPQAPNTKKCLRISKALDKLLHFVYIYLVNSILKPCHQARHNARASPSWSY